MAALIQQRRTLADNISATLRRGITAFVVLASVQSCLGYSRESTRNATEVRAKHDSSGRAQRTTPWFELCVICAPGKGRALVQVPGGGYSVFLDFDRNGRREWTAHTRPGAIARMIGETSFLTGRLSGKLPRNGAVVNITVTEQDTTSMRVRGRFRSPPLGDFHFVGTLSGPALNADLYRVPGGVPVGKLTVLPLTTRAPLANYADLAAKIRNRIVERSTIAQRNSAGWDTAFDEFQKRMSEAVDDPDVLLAFSSLLRRIDTKTIELVRDANRAACLDGRGLDIVCPREPARAVKPADVSHVGAGWVLAIKI